MWNEILSKYYMEVILKLNIFCLLFDGAVQQSCPVMSIHELPQALMCAHEYPGVPRSTHEYGSMVP